MEPQKGSDTRISKTLDTALLYSLPVTILGAAMRLKHIHGANQLLMVGLSTVALVALFKFWLKKTFEGYAAGTAIFFGCLAVLFKLMHFQGTELLAGITVVAGIFYAGAMAKNAFAPMQNKEDK